MKRVPGLAIISVFVLTAIFLLRAGEDKIRFQNRPAPGRFFAEPPGLRAGRGFRPSLANGFAPAAGNQSITIHPGWPRTYKYGKGIGWCGPVRMIASDLDGDGKAELAIMPHQWNFGLIFNDNGETQGRMQVPFNYIEMAAAGDVDNDKKGEIVTLTASDANPLLLYSFDGLGRPEIKKNLRPQVGMSMPVLAKLNEDGPIRIIIKSGSIGHSMVLVCDGSGNIVSKFNTRLEENVGSLFAVNPVIGNFDNDRELEIAVPLWRSDDDDVRSTRLEVFDMDGTPVPGWKNVDMPDLIYDPVCGDLDGDGRDEIIACGWQGTLFVLSGHDRSLLRTSFSEGQAFGSPALGDINNDGRPEIVINLFHNWEATRLMAVDRRGQWVFGQTVSGHALFSPLIADINGDGNSDVIFGNYDFIYAFDGQGNQLDGFPVPISANTGFMTFGPGVSICDIDRDGKIEITYTRDNGDGGEFSLYVLDLDRPYNPNTMAWPMQRHNAGYSGRYVDPMSIHVVSPKGGEQFMIGSSCAITWSARSPIDKVNIDYSLDRGGSWEPVASGTANDGHHAWIIPKTPSPDCLVRVGAAAEPGRWDSCNSPFAIAIGLEMLAERHEAQAFSIVHQYGRIQFTAETYDVPVAGYRIMRRRDQGDFIELRKVMAAELQGNRFEMLDKYLESGIPYTYRAEAFDAADRLIGRSPQRTI